MTTSSSAATISASTIMPPQVSYVLDIYQQIATVTEIMLASARIGNWGSVLKHGQRYSALVEQLRLKESSVPLDDVGRATKYDLLVRILNNDARTRELAFPQLARLGELLSRMKRQESLLHNYGLKASAL
jgi:flagellar protein FliT